MERNAMKDLLAWKNSSNRKPLVVNGARQVGKTWLVAEFAKREFDDLAHVNFLENEEMQRAFSASLDPARLLMIIGAATGTSPANGRTLVFLDEIQECPRAITSLKLFAEQKPEIPLITAGSLLGVALNRVDEKGGRASWPVGKVSYLDLHPMTFDEFLDAIGRAPLADIVRSADFELMAVFHERLEESLKEYLFVGGMPEAVLRYAETSSFSQVRTVQSEILRGYDHDFSKHVEKVADTERIRQTWRSVAVQLARESDMKRFTYAAIKERARGRDYRDAVAWLEDAGLITKVNRISKPGLPLMAYCEGTYFKLYLLDVGLLGAMTSLNASLVIEGSRLFTEYKGAYAEQYVCQQLVSSNVYRPYYWSADGKASKGEIDFIVEKDDAVLPIEVKAADNVKSSSLSSFMRRYELEKGMRFSTKDYADQGWLVNLPLCAAISLPEIAISI